MRQILQIIALAYFGLAFAFGNIFHMFWAFLAFEVLGGFKTFIGISVVSVLNKDRE